MCPPTPGPGAPGPPRARCLPIRPSPPPSASSRGEQESLLVSVQRGAESEATPSAGGDRGAVEGETPADGHRQVAAYRRGAMPEVVEEGVSGFLAEPDDIADLAVAIERCLTLDRASARASARRRLSLDDALDRYESALREVAR